METSAADSIVANQQSDGKEKLGTTQLLFACAQSMGLQPSWIKPHSLFAILVNNVESYVYFARSPLNSHITTSIARNKNLTRLVLARHKLQNIPYLRPTTLDQARDFLKTYKKIIAKPYNGSGSRDIHIIASASELAELDIADYILEQYIAGKEYRYLVLNDSIIAVHRVEYGTSVDVARYREQISYPSSKWDSKLVATSLHAAHVLGLSFGAVDFIIDETGKAYILEINTSPDLKWFHTPTSGPVVNVAQQFLEAHIANTEETQTNLVPDRALAVSGAR